MGSEMCIRDSLPSSTPPLQARQDNKSWLVSVAEHAKLHPMSGTKVKCRLLDPLTKKPLLQASEFLAEVNGLCSAMRSSETGHFSPFIPNASPDLIQLDRGHILGVADPLDGFTFFPDSVVASSISAPSAKPPIYEVLSSYNANSMIPALLFNGDT